MVRFGCPILMKVKFLILILLTNCRHSECPKFVEYTGSINILSKQQDPVTPLDDVPRQTVQKSPGKFPFLINLQNLRVPVNPLVTIHCTTEFKWGFIGPIRSSHKLEVLSFESIHTIAFFDYDRLHTWHTTILEYKLSTCLFPNCGVQLAC